MPLLLLVCATLGCTQRDATAPAGPQYASVAKDEKLPLYRLAVHPLHNPKQLTRTYQPLIDHLNEQIGGARFVLEASRDYQSYEAKLRARDPELLLPNPWQTLQAMKVGYRVIAMAGDAQDFKGIIVVRKDSGIKEVADLKGRVVSYPSPTALAASIMPQYFLHTHGIDVNRDVVNRYVGSQESSIMNVYLKQSSAGATWPPPWRKFAKEHPREAAQLQVQWETEPLLNNSVMVRDDVAVAVRESLLRVLVDLALTPEGRAILANMETARFAQATDLSYQPVRDFIELFEGSVRAVEQAPP